MSLNLDAAIRLTANVSGVSGINQTKTALQQLAGGSELTNRQLLGLELTTKKFAAANSNSISGIRNSISALRGLRDQHEINSKSFQRLTRDIEAYEKRLKAATMQTSAAKVAAPSVAAGLSGGIAGLGSLLPAVASGAGVAAVFGATAQLETQTRSIQVLTGSAERAKEIVSELKAIGAVTPFETSELIEASKRLNAFGVSAADVVNVTKRLGDVAGATGSNLGELATAYGQVIAKGRLQGEELLQFQERGVALADELRKMYGLTGAQFTKTLEDGAISAQAVEVALKNLTNAGGKYADGAIAQSDTLNGKLSTLRDSFTQLAQHIGTVMTPAFNFLLTNFTKVLNAANDVLQTETLRLQTGNKVPSADALRQIENDAAAMAATRQPKDLFKRNEEFQRLREQAIRNYTRQQGYENGSLTPPKVAVPVEGPAGAPPLLEKDKADKADKSADKAAREAEQLAKRAAEIAAQTAKASADLERSLMEANAKVRQNLDATTNRLAMDAIRKRYEYEEQLINRQQDLWVNSVVGAERTARGQIAGFLRDIRANESGVRDAAEQQVQREQQLNAARENERVAQRSAAMERASGQAYAASQAAIGQMGGGGGAMAGAGFSGAQLRAATAEAARFTGVANMCSESVKAFYRSLGISLPGVTAWADTVRNAGKTMRDWSQLQPGDIVATGRPGDTPHVGVYTGGNNVFHQSRKRGLAAGNYPDLDYFKQGGYFVRPSAAGSTTTPSPAQPTQPYLDTTGPGLVGARGEVQSAELELKAAQEASKGAVEQAGKLRQLINSGFLQDYGSEFREQTEAIIRSNEVTAARNALELEGARPELIDAAVRKAEAQQLYGSKVQGVSDALALLDKTGKGSTQEAKTLRQTLQSMGTDYANLTLQIDAAARAQIAFNDAMRFRQDDRIGLGIREGAQQYVESIGTMREATAQLATQGIQGVEEALVQLATTGTANFKQFAAQMLADTARVIIQQLVLRSIMQAIGGIGGGGAAASVVSSAAGSVTGGFAGIAGTIGGLIGGSAKGNVLQGPTSGYQALLHGTEAVLPVRRGSDGNLGVMVAGGGGGGTNNITINVDASGSSVQGDQGSGRELAQVVSGVVQAEMVRQSRPGGILNRRN